MDSSKSNKQLDPLHQPEGEISVQEIHMVTGSAETTAAVRALFLANRMGEISEKTQKLNSDYDKFKEKIKVLKKENHTLKQTIETVKNQNREQDETIRNLKASHDKLQKELQEVKAENNLLQIEIESANAKNNVENRKYKDQLDALKKELEEVENENKELKRSLEELTNSNNSLKQEVDSIKEENRQIRDENKQIKEENKQLKDEFGSLKVDHQRIGKKLECKEASLALGQVAWLLEAEIWKAVLPNEDMGKTGIFRSMKRWLKKNSSEPKGEEAQKRWDDLKDKLHWDEEEHPYGLKQLKALRIGDAHPEVDLEVARKQLKEGDYLAGTDKKVCEEIIDMVIKARELKSSM